MRLISFFFGGCGGLCVVTACGQSLVINPSVAGPIQHTTYASHLVSTDVQTFTAPTPAVSLHDYNAITMTFRAPQGYAWFAQADYPGTYNSLHCVFAYGAKPQDASVRRVDYRFDFVPGMESSVFYNGEGWGTGWVSYTGFGFDGAFQFDGDVAFTALTITTYAAPGYDVLPLEGFSEAWMRFEMTGAVPTTDPGPHTFLVPVPEPGAGALMTLAGVVWISKRSIV